MNLQELMATEELQIKRLHELVELTIKEQQLLSSKLQEAEQDIPITFGQRMADKLASFGGSWTFIISFLFLILAWILANTYLVTQHPFDPYPFILLNLILSCLASLQAPIIMMSQNRQEDIDRRRARNDYMVNLKAEIEVRSLQSKMDLLMTEQMKSLFDIQKTQLDLLTKIEKSMKTE